jgi:hypothetical protein
MVQFGAAFSRLVQEETYMLPEIGQTTAAHLWSGSALAIESDREDSPRPLSHAFA